MTRTGRLTNAPPQLQNVPTRTAAGQEIREAFLKYLKDRKNDTQS